MSEQQQEMTPIEELFLKKHDDLRRVESFIRVAMDHLDPNGFKTERLVWWILADALAGHSAPTRGLNDLPPIEPRT